MKLFRVELFCNLLVCQELGYSMLLWLMTICIFLHRVQCFIRFVTINYIRRLLLVILLLKFLRYSLRGVLFFVAPLFLWRCLQASVMYFLCTSGRSLGVSFYNILSLPVKKKSQNICYFYNPNPNPISSRSDGNGMIKTNVFRTGPVFESEKLPIHISFYNILSLPIKKKPKYMLFL